MNKTKLCRYGEMIYRPNGVVGRSLELYGEFAEQEVQFLRALVRSGQTVLDVGADIGAHTLALAKLVGTAGRVLAFEPRRGPFYALCGNVALNNLHHVRCYQVVAGERAGNVPVAETDDAEPETEGHGQTRKASGGAHDAVPVLRIDDLSLDACHVIKIGTSGSAEHALKGAAQTIRRLRPCMYIADDRSDKSAALRALLFEFGYELYVHRPPLYNPANFAGQRDDAFPGVTSQRLYAHHAESPSPVRPDQFGLERLAKPARGTPPVPPAAGAPASFDEARRLHQAGSVEQAVALYRRVLLDEPNNAQAWYLMGAACVQLGQLDEARASLRQATSVNPRHADAHNHLGVVLAQQAALDDAIASFRRALELKPDNLEVLNNLGLALLRQDKPKEAIAIFQRALEIKPEDNKARHNLNRALREQGHFEELLVSQRHAVGQFPDSAQAHNDLGLTLYEQGRFEEAATAFRQALMVKPDLAEAHNNLGLVHASQSRLDEAISAYRRAIVLKPAFAEAHNNLGIALRQSGQAEAAVASCREAARIKPDLPEAHNNLGSALEEVGRYEEAIDVLNESLRIKPDFAKAHNNLGIAYWYLGRFDEASKSYRRAIDLTPEMAEAHNNLGNVLRDQGNFDDAEACYRQAADLKPNYADPHWNQSLIWLLRGDFERGWAEYEWRWKLKNFKARACEQPLWDGSSLEGKTILLAAEQGLGDTVQFIRYAPLVKARGARVLAEVQRPLRQILGTCPGIDELTVQGETPPPFDTYTTLLSLPLLLGTKLETVPADVPYLTADPALVAAWRDEVRSLGNYRIGIAWKGSPQNRTDRGRSLPLALFEALARVPGVTLVSLQKGIGTEQVAEVADRFRVAEFGERLDATAGPFMDTAAIMQHLDLVVTCDSSLAHLAGALGVPVWIALMLTPDWRWMLEREDTPWYPTARLFRQTRVGEWPSVFDRMAAVLRERPKA
ncbi:MAG TPA: FkbM family methyltransferase [Pirellulales bacterium]|nr:FkbM family methyltransferase [Pirellulales bacterium]